jgi:glycosyltransferase involved in cell wall biosynthesis
MSSRILVIVTPCKNEEKNLSNLADSIINNTIKPYLWIILNDGSTDNSKNILDNLENEYPWIKVIQGENVKRDI